MLAEFNVWPPQMLQLCMSVLRCCQPYLHVFHVFLWRYVIMGLQHMQKSWCMSRKERLMPELRQEQIQQNYEVFQAQLPQLVATYRGKFALMHDREIVEFFDTARDAYVAG